MIAELEPMLHNFARGTMASGTITFYHGQTHIPVPYQIYGNRQVLTGEDKQK
jgi:hypothetical protein